MEAGVAQAAILVAKADRAEHADMSVRRFKVGDLSGSVVRVGGREAAHALRVLRLGVGAEVVLFDGHGREVVGKIRSAGAADFEVAVLRAADFDPEQGPSAVIAVPAPKGQRVDWLVEKCAELGIRAVWLLDTTRAEVLPGEGKMTRLRRKAVAAAKQAGGAFTMSIEPPRDLTTITTASCVGRMFYGSPAPSATNFAAALRELPLTEPRRDAVRIFIGPEGGFTDSETAAIEAAGGRAVRFCDSLLRVETAAVAAAAIWAAWAAETREDLPPLDVQ